MLIALTIIAMILLIILGAPIFSAMGVASMIHYLEVGRASAGVVLAQRLFQGVTGFAGAVTAVTGTLSPMIIPPSIVLIIYGSTFTVSIGALFAAGLSIALFLGIVYMLLTYFLVRSSKQIPTRHPRATRAEFWDATKKAVPSLGMPVIVVGGMLFGYFTATEAAAIAVFYSLFVTMILYKSISPRQLPAIFRNAALTSAAVAILVGVAISFSYVMVRRNVLGYSPVHTAMIIVMALGAGHMTPPVGGTLLTPALVGKMSVVQITHYVWPYIPGRTY